MKDLRGNTWQRAPPGITDSGYHTMFRDVRVAPAMRAVESLPPFRHILLGGCEIRVSEQVLYFRPRRFR